MIVPHQWLGLAEISILLTLAENQPDPTNAKSADEILAMRQAGAAWGTIARALGCRNLSAVIRAAALQAVEAREALRRERGA